MADMTELLVIGGVLVGGYFAYTSGMLDSILGGLGGGPQYPVFDQYEKEAEEDDDDDEDEKKGGKRGGKKGGKGGEEGGKGGRGGGKGGKRKKRREDVYQQGPPMGYPSYQQPPYQPPPAAPGLLSSMIPQNIPQYPPYTSQTVNTYSPYSPYNQFSSYQEYRTPPRGTASTMADDNINFNDIDAGKSYQCYQCKTFCQASPGSMQCQMCRMPCKNITHTFIPPARGWTIAPVGTTPYGQGGGGGGYSPYGSYLGMIADTLLGKGATFAEMDDYSQKKRFDCHNKLKRRVKGKDNQFVTQSDYYYDRNDIQFANA